jgi:hypothetical protein
MTTSASSLAKRRAMARPIPRLAPVMTASLLCRVILPPSFMVIVPGGAAKPVIERLTPTWSGKSPAKHDHSLLLAAANGFDTDLEPQVTSGTTPLAMMACPNELRTV